MFIYKESQVSSALPSFRKITAGDWTPQRKAGLSERFALPRLEIKN
jgi:hypothetical protein